MNSILCFFIIQSRLHIAKYRSKPYIFAIFDYICELNRVYE